MSIKILPRIPDSIVQLLIFFKWSRRRPSFWKVGTRVLNSRVNTEITGHILPYMVRWNRVNLSENPTDLSVGVRQNYTL